MLMLNSLKSIFLKFSNNWRDRTMLMLNFIHYVRFTNLRSERPYNVNA